MRLPQWPLFPKYAALIMALVATLLVASGGVGLWFSYRENQDHLVALQVEKAQAAAARIEQYVLDIEQQVSWTALPGLDAGADAAGQRRIDYLKLLRQAPAVTEVAWIDPQGREQLRVSRLAMDSVGRGTDVSATPMFKAAMAGQVWRSPVSFRKETEPYMTIARRAGPGGGVTAVDVNLKFVWEVVSRIRIGQAGLAYVVDDKGTLIAHPDISLVLKKTDLSVLPHVAAALAAGPGAPALRGDARNAAGQPVLAAQQRIAPLGWTVVVESPRAEAFAPLYATLWRMALVLAAGLVLAALASFVLARALVRPIRAIQEGAARVGAGELDHRLALHTGDELQALAGEFNRMAEELKASYAGLEGKVAARTAELQRRADELAMINSIQLGMAEALDFQAIVDLVGDKLRAVLASDNIGIRWFDPASGKIHFLYEYEHGQRLQVEPLARIPGGPGDTMERTRRAVVLNTPAEMAAAGIEALPGTDSAKSVIFVPIVGSDRLLGCIVLEDHEHEHAWGETEVRMLGTVAGSMGVALENARLLLETKTALERQTATAEVLGAISGSVDDAQPVFEKIMDSCRHLFAADSLCLLQLDAAQQLQMVAQRNFGAGLVTGLFPRPLAGSGTELALQHGGVLHFPDVQADPDLPAATRDITGRLGTRSMVVAPLQWQGRAVGSIIVARHRPQPFDDEELDLLKTFADQAVIAIQNARLFNALQDKTRELEAANRHKSEFLANMSHELRTPLNAIIGFSEVLAEQMFGELNDKQLEYMKDIHASGQHLLALINDVLDLSKIEAGRMELELSCFDLGLLLEHSATLVRERAQRHGLALELDVGEGLGEWVADARKVKQAVVNLLANAVKFTPNGGRVTVRARHLNGVDGRVGDWAEISVADTGIGIAPDDQALVFEEFRQASGDVLRKAEGTGLGLALVKRFVELHGGSVRLASEVGRGSTFTLTLPQHEVGALQ